MKVFINVFLLILLADYSFCQETNGVNQNNIEPATNSIPPSSNEVLNEYSIEEEAVDTLMVESDANEKINTKALRKMEQAPSRDLKKSKDKEAYETKTESTSFSQEMKKAEYSIRFDKSKDAANTQVSQRSPTIEQQTQMNTTIDFFETNDPASFEYNYYKYVGGNYNTDLVEYLDNAESLKPNNSDVQIQKAAYCIITEDESSAKPYLSKLVESGRLSNVDDYCEDLLLSMPDSATLITHGFDDTYGSYYLKLENSVRPDVNVVSLDFMQSETYREKLENDGFVLPNEEVIDVNFFKKLCELNTSKKLFISMTLPKDYLASLKDNIYVNGLAFEYSETKINNVSVNKSLWKTKLEKHLVYNAVNEKEKRLSSNYLPMLLLLWKAYNEEEDDAAILEIEKAIEKVSVQCNKYEQVKAIKGSY